MRSEGAQANLAALEETLGILKEGRYRLGSRTVTLKLSPERMRGAIYCDAEAVAKLRARGRALGPGGGRCAYRVVEADSFRAARELSADLEPRAGGSRVLVLNFANPVSPGGGVRRGAQAQEEDLCRASSLLMSLESEAARPYYEAHRALGSALASDAMLFTPEVEIIRGDDGCLLAETAVVSVLTCAVPAVSLGRAELSREELSRLLRDRIRGMLSVAADRGCDALVLGAWGCGAFGNDPKQVAAAFAEALREFEHERGNPFRVVTFAIVDGSGEKARLRAFQRQFCPPLREGVEARQARVWHDRIRGCLLGGAIGDALGTPVEFMSWDEIRGRYGAEGIREYEMDRWSSLALISDDTQMALFTACGLLCARTQRALAKGAGATAAPTTRFLHRAYLDWLATQEEVEEPPASWIMRRDELFDRRAPGNTCLSALASGRMGSTRRRINHSKGCGGAMRVAPVGLLHPEWAGEKLDALDRLGAEAAAITHGHPMGFIPAAFLTHAIHRCAFRSEEDETLPGILAEALAAVERLYAEEPELADFSQLMRDAMELANGERGDPENIDALGGGWCGDSAVAIAVYCALRHGWAFDEAVIAAVNHSGDSDSTAAIAGNLLGAWLGCDRIQRKWKQNLELSGLVLELADDICMLDVAAGFDRLWLERYGARAEAAGPEC